MTDTPRPTNAEDATAGDAATPVPDAPRRQSAAAPSRSRSGSGRYVERFLVPLVLPIAVDRRRRRRTSSTSRGSSSSAHGHIPIFVGLGRSLLTILLGATVLSAARRACASRRSRSVAPAFILVDHVGGWLVLGHSQEKAGADHAAARRSKTTQTVTGRRPRPAAALTFAPDELNGEDRRLATINVVGRRRRPHASRFDDPTTLFGGAEPRTRPGRRQAASRIFSGAAGSYTFFCAIPGHEAAGMQGTITVTGPPMTLDAGADGRRQPADRGRVAALRARGRSARRARLPSSPGAGRRARRRRRPPSGSTRRATRAARARRGTCCTFGCATCVPLNTLGKFHEELAAATSRRRR